MEPSSPRRTVAQSSITRSSRQAEARSMLASLGMDPSSSSSYGAFNTTSETPSPRKRSFTERSEGALPAVHEQEQPRPGEEGLRALLAARDAELATLREANAALTTRCSTLEASLKAARRASSTPVQPQQPAKQMETLERAFAEQELLLAGYQKDSERSMLLLDSLKKREAKLAAFLERLYGNGWEEELALHLDRPKGSSLPVPQPSGMGGAGTPASAARRKGRVSSLPPALDTPVGSRPAMESPISEEPEGDTSDTSFLAAAEASTSSSFMSPQQQSQQQQPGLSPEQVETLLALLRGMETRLLTRDAELGEQEVRAREEAGKAQGLFRKVEGLRRDELLAA